MREFFEQYGQVITTVIGGNIGMASAILTIQLLKPVFVTILDNMM